MCSKALVVFTPQDSVELFGGNEGKQILSFVTKQGYGSREYQIENEWYFKPEGKVRGLRYNLREVLFEVKSLANIWRYIKERSIEPPNSSDKILEQLALSRLNSTELRIFSPWGPRYNKKTSKIY